MVEQVTKKKFMDYKILTYLNESSVNDGRNRNFWMENLPVNKEHYFPVVFAMNHNDSEMRLKLVLNEQGETGWLDVSFEEFDALPEYDGKIEESEPLSEPKYMLDAYEAIKRASKG